MKNWLITGANRGIGLEFARQAAAAGHRVIATARDPQRAEELKKLVASGRVEIASLDVTSPDSFARLHKLYASLPLDVLVNNAGTIGPKRQSALNMDFDGFAETLAVNVFGPLRAIQTFAPNLEAAGHAKVAAISSMMGSIGKGGSYQLAYSASKAALNRLLRGLAQELKAKSVAIGIYSPGWVRTDMGGDNAPLSVEDSVAGLMKRIGELDLECSGEFINWNGKPLLW